MSNVAKVSGATLAAATALLFAAGAAHAADQGKSAEHAKIQCFGINACKGQAACKTANNECKGQNSCKGTGYIVTTKADCEAKDGKIGGK